MIAAILASIHCNATKFSPRLRTFWKNQKINTPTHSCLDKLKFCPSSLASAIPSIPEIKNLSDKTRKGGALDIKILADVNALDQITENKMPINMDLKSIESMIYLFPS